MNKGLFLHKKQKVIVWGITAGAVNPEIMMVKYSYLRPDGRIGTERTKNIWENDYGSEFKSIGQHVSIYWK